MKKVSGLEFFVMALGALFLFVFTYYGFYTPQLCDADKQYLYCHLHPAGPVQIFGCALFYLGAAFLTGFYKLFGVEIYQEKGENYGLIGALVTVAGVLIIFLS